ncbi:chorismate mutase [Catenulispora sp. GP43]|uniref:chorismate mutase n=1 Tax=Catenulispora sp. GP43 TaxID=3156263 RepID=UPI003519087E
MTASATADPTSPDSVSLDAVSTGQSVSTGQAVSPGQPTPAGVRTGRAQIDDLDARILALITERVTTAADIQAARIAEGGRRLDLKRETEIIARYREALGRPGVTVAMAVLELCRGRV